MSLLADGHLAGVHPGPLALDGLPLPQPPAPGAGGAGAGRDAVLRVTEDLLLRRR